MKQLGFAFDMSRCSGCMACVVACMDQNDIPGDGQSFRQVVKLEQGAYPSVQMAFVTLACFHCNDAPCLRQLQRRGRYSSGATLRPFEPPAQNV